MVKYTDIHSNANFRDMFEVDNNAIYKMKNLHKGPDLSKFMIKSYGEQLREACRAMNTYPVDIDFVVISASTYAASKMVLDTMKLPLERSGLECLTKIPHMGTNDLIYQIKWGIEQGLIKNGSKILISGTSMGFSIATMAIEWGVQ
jgi:3-oxoacyl-[acyl-carrier-protein] synthase III